LLARIQFLNLEANQLSGGIPPPLLNCSELNFLNLYDNRLTGEIPPEIGTKLYNLEVLRLWKNELNGTIPKSLGNCSQLLRLQLSKNFLTGEIPLEFGKLQRLQALRLYMNHLVSAESIPIFEAFSNCTNLEFLNLSGNELGGDMPESIGQLPQKLVYLDLSGNRFTGRIPQEISNLTGLFLLGLAGNYLTGGLPSALERLSTLQSLVLASNNLEGTIPYQFSQLTALYELNLSGNKFSGEIHQVFASLQQLRRLDLSYNKFSGNIPDSIGECSSLELVDLSYNQLTGVMPQQVASLRNLQFYINVSHNALTGRLPAELGGMQMVQAIDLSANKFSGSIPGKLVNCAGLDYLNLSYNSLEGTIPTLIGQVAGLQDMDFSFNMLSGPLPRSIEKLGKLRHLNLSYNKFTGEIPSSGAFRKLNFTSFLGNTALCGRWIELSPCKLTTKRHHDSKRRMVILATSVGSALLAVSFLVFLKVLICFDRKKSEAITETLAKIPWIKLRETEILREEEVNRATEGFSPDNLLGSGHHGSVYKGVLDNGSVVAVKVIHSPTSGGADKTLIKECKTLGRIRHRNLVRIMGVCSSLQVLVMEFMSQGSLDKHLHCSKNNSKLGLKRRLSILKDVAHGMAYLHNHCSPAIVHRDLKPSNVLLDETMTARVGDFSVSRLIISAAGHGYSTEASGDTSSLVIGSIGYTAPEYGVGGRLSMKGDVYSYGILVLETITGKRPTDPLFSGSTLQGWVGDAFPDRLMEVIDGNVVEEIRKEEEDEVKVEQESHDLSEKRNAIKGHGVVVWLVKIGVMCSKEAPHERPTLREVEVSLEQLVAKIREGF
jgi:Leucine-rich repeat (LRR) protein